MNARGSDRSCDGTTCGHWGGTPSPCGAGGGRVNPDCPSQGRQRPHRYLDATAGV